MAMKLYLLTQDVNNGYDTYDSMVVCAESKTKARLMHPSQYRKELTNEDINGGTWVSLNDAKQITIKLIGQASPSIKPGVVLASFNAG